MKNITKRLMAMFLAVMMLATLLPLSVFAVDEGMYSTWLAVSAAFLVAYATPL